MEDFWKMIIALVVKFVLEWLTSQDKGNAAKAGTNLAIAKKAYDAEMAETA